MNGNKRKIANVDVPVYLIGNSAYTLSTFLMKPFDYNITQLQDVKQYNYRVSRARIVTENAFGRLKARWRRFSKQNDMSVERVHTIVTTCCILHNMCEVHSDSFNNDWLAELSSFNEEPATTIHSDTNNDIEHDGKIIRQALIEYFKNYPLQ